VLHVFYTIGDYSVESKPEHGYKINSIDGDSCYKKTYRYAVSRSSMRLSKDEGLSAEIVEILDYGNVRFARAKAGDQEFLIEAGDAVRLGPAKVVFGSEDISVYSIESDMKIC
jgi:hypothetical protein